MDKNPWSCSFFHPTFGSGKTWPLKGDHTMTPTDELKEEHQGILLMLKILDKVCVKLESKEKVDPDHLERIVEFFRVFADKCHHGKEEDLLFPEMEKSGVPKERGPIGVMLIEHDQGRAFVKGMGEAATRYKKGESTGLAEFTKNARDYIALLTQHINKENNILFPMGDRAISREKQGELVEAFETLEREKIGAGTHEKFHQLLHHLQEVYLK
jgi:hemerythrin-like domain-containing protein